MRPMVEKRALLEAAGGSPFWRAYLTRAFRSSRISIHLAVFEEPYLRYVLDGSKTVESRFTKRAIPPYQRIRPGDIVLVKRTGAGIEGICRATDVWYYRLEQKAWSEIRDNFGSLMRTTSGFLRSRSKAKFCTLIRIDEVFKTPSLSVRKRDRRGWVVLLPRVLPEDDKRTPQPNRRGRP